VVDSEAEGNDAAIAAILEAGVTAAMGGHDIGHWESTEEGWNTVCKVCGALVRVGKNGVLYSQLDDSCPGRRSRLRRLRGR